MSFSVIPANAGIQESRLAGLDSRSPIRSRTSFAGVTALETFYETIKTGGGARKCQKQQNVSSSIIIDNGAK